MSSDFTERPADPTSASALHPVTVYSCKLSFLIALDLFDYILEWNNPYR